MDDKEPEDYGPDPPDIGLASDALAKVRMRIESNYYIRLAKRVTRMVMPKRKGLARVLGLAPSEETTRLATLVGVAAARLASSRDEFEAHGLVVSASKVTREIETSNANQGRRVIQLQESLISHSLEKIQLQDLRLTHVLERPKLTGSMGRTTRWGWRDRARARAIELYEAKTWDSKQHCAATITPEIEALVVSLGQRLSASNAEKTVYSWLLEHKTAD